MPGITDPQWDAIRKTAKESGARQAERTISQLRHDIDVLAKRLAKAESKTSETIADVEYLKNRAEKDSLTMQGVVITGITFPNHKFQNPVIPNPKNGDGWINPVDDATFRYYEGRWYREDDYEKMISFYEKPIQGAVCKTPSGETLTYWHGEWRRKSAMESFKR